MSVDEPKRTPPINPNMTANENPTTVVIKVCHALASISARHSHPEAKIAVGAGNTNCSMSKARTTISQRTKMAMMTIQGRAFRAARRRSRERLRGFDGPLPMVSSRSMSLSRRPHQHQRNRRHVADQHQGRKVDQHEWNHAAIDRAQRLVEDRLRGEQVEAERRCVHA